MSCWFAFFCVSALASGPVLFQDNKSPEELLRVVPGCDTRTCCIQREIVQRLPRLMPYNSKTIMLMISDTFRENKETIEANCSNK